MKYAIVDHVPWKHIS